MKVQAVVYRKNRIRKGKGFSKAELREVNMDLTTALRLGIPTDPRRRSKHEENIELLRRYLENLKASKQPEDKNVEE
ncbi:MAG: ribosomal protein L13e [Candidatus Bathyarchaeia archaeon]